MRSELMFESTVHTIGTYFCSFQMLHQFGKFTVLFSCCTNFTNVLFVVVQICHIRCTFQLRTEFHRLVMSLILADLCTAVYGIPADFLFAYRLEHIDCYGVITYLWTSSALTGQSILCYVVITYLWTSSALTGQSILC